MRPLRKMVHINKMLIRPRSSREPLRFSFPQAIAEPYRRSLTLICPL